MKIILALATAIVAISAGTECLAQSAAAPFMAAKRYDLMRRVVGTLSPDPDGTGPRGHLAVRNTYDDKGRLTKIESGELSAWQTEATAPVNWSGFTIFQVTDITYDLSGRKTKQVVSDAGVISGVVQFSYDGMGRVVCQAVRMNPQTFAALPADACARSTPDGTYGPDRITKTTWDADGRPLIVKKAFGVVGYEQDYATYGYSPGGRRTSVKDANQNLATFTYDALGRMKKWNFPSPSTTNASNPSDFEEYGYDLNGNRISFRKRDGRTITFDYDPLNRIKEKIWPDGNVALNVYYTYDLRNLQITANYGTGVGVTTLYDNLGRLTLSNNSSDGVDRPPLRYQYDPNGNRTELTYPDGLKASFAYDGLDRLTHVYEGGIGSTVANVTITYDSEGRRSSMTRRYGDTTTYAYNPPTPAAYHPDGALRELVDNLGGTSADITTSFAWNPAGQIVSRTRSNDAFVFNGTVDVSRRYASNGLNQYVTVTSGGQAVSFANDANGNLRSDGTMCLDYDVENRLLQKRAPAANCDTATAVQASLRYDPLGRLLEVAGGGATTRFLYDGDELLVEYNTAGAILRRYVHGPGADDPLVWYEGSGFSDPRYPHVDHQGSITAVASGISAGPHVINSYDEWGIPSAGNSGRFQYTGQAWLGEIGMYHYKARIYSPTLGRFLQTDPIGYDDQVNLYAYVGNDPVNATDPSGMYECKTEEDCKAAAAGRAKIEAARESYKAPQIGSLIGNRAAVGALDKTLATLGTKNDGNGLSVKAGDLPDDEPANFDPKTNTITLDPTALAKSSEFSIGGALAHEVQHYRQRGQKLGNVAEEVRPYIMQHIVDRSPYGKLYMDSRSTDQYVRAHLPGYCPAGGNFCNNWIKEAMQSEPKKPF